MGWLSLLCLRLASPFLVFRSWNPGYAGPHWHIILHDYPLVSQCYVFSYFHHLFCSLHHIHFVLHDFDLLHCFYDSLPHGQAGYIDLYSLVCCMWQAVSLMLVSSFSPLLLTIMHSYLHFRLLGFVSYEDCQSWLLLNVSLLVWLPLPHSFVLHIRLDLILLNPHVNRPDLQIFLFVLKSAEDFFTAFSPNNSPLRCIYRELPQSS